MLLTTSVFLVYLTPAAYVPVDAIGAAATGSMWCAAHKGDLTRASWPLAGVAAQHMEEQ